MTQRNTALFIYIYVIIGCICDFASTTELNSFWLSCPAGSYADWNASWGDPIYGSRCTEWKSDSLIFYDTTTQKTFTRWDDAVVYLDEMFVTFYEFREHFKQLCEKSPSCYGISCLEWLESNCIFCLKSQLTNHILTEPVIGTGGSTRLHALELNRNSTQCVTCSDHSYSAANSNHSDDCKSPELEFFSHGNLDNANSCELRCPIGFYQLGGLSNEVCRRHMWIRC